MSASDPLLWLAHGLGLGHVPLAPGSAGALAGAVLALGLARLGGRARGIATLLLIGLALAVSDHADRAGPDHDDSRIVADELLAFPLATVALPVQRNPGLLAGVFLASRALDAVKPPPARAAERLGGGLGIVLDDVVTNLYALALGLLGLHACRWWRGRRGTGG